MRWDDDVSICIFSITHFDYESESDTFSCESLKVRSHESILTSSDDRLMKSDGDDSVSSIDTHCSGGVLMMLD